MGTSKILCLSAFLMNFKWLFHLRIYQSSEKIVIGFDSIYLDHFLRIQSITTGKINLSFRMGTSKILSLGFNSKELLNGSSVYSLLFNTSHGILIREKWDFPQNPFIPAWSLSKSLLCLLLHPGLKPFLFT